jgi:integrase
MKTLITDRTLRGLRPAPAGTRTVLWDSAVPSLCVRVTDKGAASFNVMRRLRGRIIRRMIGISWHVPFPAGQPLPYALSDARDDARAAILDISRGIDPKKRKETERGAEAQRQANSFGSVAEAFIQKHVSGLKSGPEVETTIRRELIPKLGSRPIADITRRDVVELIEVIADSGRKYAAHKLFNYVSKLFAWAIARHIYGLETSPCTGVKPSEIAGKKEPRQRVLSDSEIRALWKATEGLGYPAAPFVRLLLLTGQRLREVAEMTWSEIDIDKVLWTIPADRMKGDSAHEVPLSTMAVEILKSLPRWTGPFVFTTTGGARPISGFSKMKARLDTAIKEPITPWRFHDLRRSMRTGLSALRVPDVVSELCIAHTQKGLHKVYDQHAYLDEKRHAFESWANRVLAICEPGGQSNVIPIMVPLVDRQVV